MDKLRLSGGAKLFGKISISGAKNAALPLIAASLLTRDEIIIHQVPDLADVITMASLLKHHGAKVSYERHLVGNTFSLKSNDITSLTAPYDLVRKMRASVLVLGPLLARYGQASVSLPGGCSIGTRPIDLHLEGLRLLGAKVNLEDGYINTTAPKGLIGCEIRLPKISVGATENLMMAACLAKGETFIHNSAKEPEIVDLAKLLSSMGAEIHGAGTEIISIKGVKKLQGAEHKVIPDRIEAGTYAVAAAITYGNIKLEGVLPEHLNSTFEVLRKCGVNISINDEHIQISNEKNVIKACDISTQPYPGFPTDMQAQIMTLLSIADGLSIINENIFENRFMHIPELTRMGAKITQEGSVARINGVDRLRGAPVMATDLRASVSLVLAALVADGDTVINRIYHLDRGYDDLVGKLNKCGAKIERYK
ncbi:UDP-N-acetylglucosamine 1-carboxyvinyltransferase [Alphaproteobacteria bacterium]|nr:UDP-N-acetylglucosamine 1-carboxyvinyltransferase [Alphaproteobacteria bacterium]